MHLCCFNFRRRNGEHVFDGYILSYSIEDMVSSLLKCAESETMMPILLKYEMVITRIIPNIIINRCYENNADNVLNLDLNIIADSKYDNLNDKRDTMVSNASEQIKEFFKSCHIIDLYEQLVSNDSQYVSYVSTKENSFLLHGKSKRVNLEIDYPKLIFKVFH